MPRSPYLIFPLLAHYVIKWKINIFFFRCFAPRSRQIQNKGTEWLTWKALPICHWQWSQHIEHNIKDHQRPGSQSWISSGNDIELKYIIAVYKRGKSSGINVELKPEADFRSDHELLQADFRIKRQGKLKTNGSIKIRKTKKKNYRSKNDHQHWGYGNNGETL